MKVVVNHDRCEGHARCQSFAPEVFRLDANDQSQVLMEDVPDNLRTRVEEAIRLCPRQAISWVNVT
ncbi:MAG TPA: ferredoxin [Tepidiformaceae bacterium]|jgi:ferredoxin